MYCSAEISRKLKYLSFLAAVGVVCLHTKPVGCDNVPVWATTFFDWWMGFHSWGVPFFFVVSGFFFDRGCEGGLDYRALISKKWRTLVIPYFLWGAVIGGLLWTPLWMLTNSRNGLPLFGNTFLGANNVLLSADWLLGIFRNGPANPTLWFVRMLIVAFLLAPVWFWIRRQSRALLAVLAVAGVIVFTPVTHVSPMETLFTVCGYPFLLKAQGIAWFLVGMTVSAFRLDEREMPYWLTVVSFLGWIVLHGLGDVKYFPFFIIPALWGAIDRVLPYLPEKVPEWMTLTFWLYCCHGPVSGWIGGGYRAFLGNGVGSYLVQLTTMWLVVTVVCYLLAFVTKMCAPKLYTILNGGR